MPTFPPLRVCAYRPASLRQENHPGDVPALIT
jgi:hypothetical protein